MKSEFVLMDFDGVIADTFQMCLDITRQALPNETVESYRQRLTDDINNTLAEIKSAGFDFFSEYSQQILDQSISPDLLDIIEYIGGTFTTIIVSSTISQPIKDFLKHHNLTQYFAAVFGNDVPSPKSTKFKAILEHYQIKPSECVFVTDTLSDIKEANLVDIPVIAVTWGYHDENTLRQGNIAALVDLPTQLKGAIEETLEFSSEYNE